MHSIKGEELKQLQLRLKNQLRNLIDNISVYGVGIQRSLIQKGLKNKIIEKRDLAEKVKAKLENGDYDCKEDCAFSIKFRTGNRQILKPYKDQVLDSEYDADLGRTLSIQYLPDGSPIVDIDLDSSRENETIKRIPKRNE